MKLSSLTRRQIRFMEKEFGMDKEDIAALTRREAFADGGLVDALIDIAGDGLNNDVPKQTRKGRMADEILDVVIDMKGDRPKLVVILISVFAIPIAILSFGYAIKKLVDRYSIK